MINSAMFLIKQIIRKVLFTVMLCLIGSFLFIVIPASADETQTTKEEETILSEEETEGETEPDEEETEGETEPDEEETKEDEEPEPEPEPVTGLVITEEGIFYYTEGNRDSSYNGFAHLADGSDDYWYYVKSGKVDETKNDIIQETLEGKTAWYLIKGGKLSKESVVAQNVYGWWAVQNGKVNFNYNGFLKNEYGWWYLEKGKVSFKVNGILQGKAAVGLEEEAVDGWWYVKDSQIKNIETVAQNAYGWWYINNGKVDFDYTGVKNNEYGWWAIQDGKVNFNYNGFLKNEYGWWYLEKGKVSFKVNGILQGKAAVGLEEEVEDGWWYVKDSKIKNIETVAQNSYGWWYINHGKVDFNYTGVKQNSYGWWRIVDGKVDFNCNSVEENEYGWWYIRNGRVDFSYTGLAENSEGWWYIKNGGVDKTFQGLAYHSGNYYYMVDGALDWSYSGEATLNGYNRPFQVTKGVVSGGVVPSTAALANKAEQILNDLNAWGDDGLKKAFKYSVMNWTVYDTSANYGIAHYATYGFENHHGNCYVMAATFVTLARELGYEAYQITGSVPSIYGGLTPHSWVEVKIGDTFYVCDPDFEFDTGSDGFLFAYKTPGTWRYTDYYRMHD